LKDFKTRLISGFFFATLLIITAQVKILFLIVLFVLGLICLYEFNKLIERKNNFSYIIFMFIFSLFSLTEIFQEKSIIINEISKIFHVISIFVLLFLVRDLFSSKSLPKLLTNNYINSTFYITGGIIFIALTALNFGDYSSDLIVGVFVLIWVNDSFAYFIGTKFGSQKLFEKISPKKTVEGFLGGLLFSAITSYLIFKFSDTLNFSNWLIISVIVSVFGTTGDLIESKYKRQAKVKNSGDLIPGHGGLLDRLDSAIFISPFLYLFLRILKHVS
tara:strand:- start:840 stop:1661 length:822 start_codon:yes stop_codon:yes gene_type:complete